MTRREIIVQMIGRGICYGTVLGAICGVGLGVLLAVVGMVFTLPAGIILGGVLGGVNGLLAGIITVRFFYPLIHFGLYQITVVLVCAAISPLLTSLGAEYIWAGRPLNERVLLFAALGLVAALIGSIRLTDWYIVKSGCKDFNKLPIQRENWRTL